MAEHWTARRLAEAAGRESTAGRDLVRRLGLTAVGRDLTTGAKLYDRDQAEAALAARPGRGSRTDRGHRRRPPTAAEQREIAERARVLDVLARSRTRCGGDQAQRLLDHAEKHLRRLIAAAARYPAHALHPQWTDPHRRPYELGTEIARQLGSLARVLDQHLELEPQRGEAQALSARLAYLTELAEQGQPLPPGA